MLIKGKNWALECYKKALCNFSAFCTESNYCLYTKPPTLSQEGNQESVLSIACYEPGEFIWLTTLTSTLIIPDITKKRDKGYTDNNKQNEMKDKQF